jgi:hypothetical protein
MNWTNDKYMFWVMGITGGILLAIWVSKLWKIY